MNTIILYVEQYAGSDTLKKDGITFKNVKVIKLLIDGEDIEVDNNFKDSLIYFSELKASCKISGKYLIFTCACGNAIDGGWEGVNVTVHDKTIEWEFEVGDSLYSFLFEKNDYVEEIESLEKFLSEDKHLVLEPEHVVFPDNFSN